MHTYRHTYSCPSGKAEFVTAGEAHHQIRKIKAYHKLSRDDGVIPATAYRCERCGFFHLSSMPPGRFNGDRHTYGRKGRKPAEPYNRHDRSWLREVEL